jgi:hypothetical protein
MKHQVIPYYFLYQNNFLIVKLFDIEDQNQLKKFFCYWKQIRELFSYTIGKDYLVIL